MWQGSASVYFPQPIRGGDSFAHFPHKFPIFQLVPSIPKGLDRHAKARKMTTIYVIHLPAFTDFTLPDVLMHIIVKNWPLITHLGENSLSLRETGRELWSTIIMGIISDIDNWNFDIPEVCEVKIGTAVAFHWYIDLCSASAHWLMTFNQLRICLEKIHIIK